MASKDRDSLQRFTKLISTLKSSQELVSSLPKQQIKKFVTVLKSPHVNKTAQEQFEFRIFNRKLFVNPLKSAKFLHLLKKSRTEVFPGST